MSLGQRLGKLGVRVMRILWSRNRATAREITDALNAGGGEEVSHSTVQTILRRLEARGALRHEVEDRAWVFVPLWREEEAASSATRELLSRVFNNSVSSLMAHLLEHEEISRDEMDRLRRLVNEADEGDPKEARHD